MLGRSGCAVSVVALGTMTFGAESSEDASHAQLDRFVEVVGTLVDTADVYAGGASEEIIGGWLAGKDSTVRDQVVLATKGRFPRRAGPNEAGLSRKHLGTALEASLRRLGVDHVDLYQVHAFDPLTSLEETLRFFDDSVSAGKSITSASRTSPAGRRSGRWRSPNGTPGPRRCLSSRSTASSCARSSGR